MRNVCALILNTLVALIAIGCVICGLALEGEGAFFFCLYTRLSNILAAVACALSVPSCARALRGSRGGVAATELQLPTWLRALKLAGFATVMVTFLTVFLILGFMVGHLSLLHDTNFFFHLVSPLLMLVLCCVVERSSAGLPRRAVALPVVLTVVYGVWYFVMVLVIGANHGGWVDFYGFNTGGMWPLSAVAMFAVSLLVAWGCWRLSGGKR